MAAVPSLTIFRHRAYAQYWGMRVLVSAAREMQAVAIGWQVYDLARETRSIEQSAFLLGLVGLTQFLPVFFLSLVGGQAADRLNQKFIIVASQLIRAAASLVLLSTFFLPASAAFPLIFTAAFAMGVVNAFVPAASNALFPRLVPRAELPAAIAWNSLGYTGASIVGPALGGLLYVLGGEVVYSTAAIMSVIAALLIATAGTPRHEKRTGAHGLAMVIDGLRYIVRNRIVLGAISIDFVAVFFGGAIALMPVYARDILQVGEEGLGLMRAAPAAGAALVAFLLAGRPLRRQVGRWMFSAVAVYGAATLVFGISPLFWLSLFALAVTGAADMISVFVRQSLIQLSTPDEMKGRVSSVSFIFISGSNELGEFESGVAARFLGPVGAVILGGSMAIGAALVWMRLFPQLARADRFDDIEEEPLAPDLQTGTGGKQEAG